MFWKITRVLLFGPGNNSAKCLAALRLLPTWASIGHVFSKRRCMYTRENNKRTRPPILSSGEPQELVGKNMCHYKYLAVGKSLGRTKKKAGILLFSISALFFSSLLNPPRNTKQNETKEGRADERKLEIIITEIVHFFFFLSLSLSLSLSHGFCLLISLCGNESVFFSFFFSVRIPTSHASAGRYYLSGGKVVHIRWRPAEEAV